MQHSPGPVQATPASEQVDVSVQTMLSQVRPVQQLAVVVQPFISVSQVGLLVHFPA